MRYRPAFAFAALFVALLCGGSAFAAQQRSGGLLAPGRLLLGVYDPSDTQQNVPSFGLEHVFVAWQAPGTGHLAEKIKAARASKRALMITVEPYTHASDWLGGADHLFSDILAGRYDAEIGDICGQAKSAGLPVLIRWGHEMEDPDGRYPWASPDAEGYKAAYRYFVSKCRRIVPGAKFVWSPKGGPRLAAYYPGAAYVDAVGVAIWGLERFEEDRMHRARSFDEAIKARLGQVGRFGKPVIVAELGVFGSAAYRKSWYADIFDPDALRRKFPQLRALVFFNAKEPYTWGPTYGQPDWRLDDDARSRLAKMRAASLNVK